MNRSAFFSPDLFVHLSACAHRRYVEKLLTLLVWLLVPFFANAQVNAGAISRSQCVTTGGLPSTFTSLRDATVNGVPGGTIDWQRDINPNFLTPTSVASTQGFTETTPIVVTTYYRRIIINGLASASSNVITVRIAPANSPTFIPTSVSPICQGDASFTVSFVTSNAATKYSIIWDPVPAGLGFQDVNELSLPGSSPLTVTVPASAPFGSYSGTLIPYDAGGCSIAGSNASFTFNPLPTVSITAPAAVCTPSTINLTSGNITTGSTAGLTYTQWKNSTATSSLANANAVTATGVYYIKGTIAATGCAVTQPVTVTINSLPTATITASGPTTFCAGGSITLTASIGNSYLWSSGQITPAIRITGGANYTVAVVSAAGCSATSSVTPVIVNPLPTAIITAAGLTTFCAGGSVTLTSGAASSYLWSTGATTQSINAINSGLYTVAVTNAAGCSVTSSATQVIVNALPIITISNPAAVCSPTTIDLTASAIISGSTTGLNYTYWRNTAATLSLTNPNAITTSGVYYIKGITTTGCSSIQPVTVTVNAQPVLNITDPPGVCSPSTVDLTLPGVTSGSSTGLVFTYWTDAAITNALTAPASVKNSGDYYIKGTNSVTGCSNTHIVTVSINTTPLININIPAAVCEPAVIDLTATSVTSGSTTGITFSYWADAATSIPITTPAAVTMSGTYYIKSVSATGCAASAAVTVTINPLPNGTLQNPTVNYICDGLSLTLNASGAFGYQWYVNQKIITGATAASYAATTTGNYTVQFMSNTGCVKNAVNSIQLNLFTKPMVAFSISNTHCAGTPVSFTNTSSFNSSGNISWTWDFGDGLSSNNLNDIHAYTNGGTYTVTLTAVNTSCPSLTEKTTASFIIETLVPGIQYDTILAVNGKSFVINARSFGTNYLWQPPTGLSSATVRAPIANLSQNASYTVTIITAAGCVTTDAVYVKVATDGEIYVPGGFTPNGDGVNDRAYPILIGIRQLNYFKIFNRWGNLVFQTNDATPSNGWDGKFSGKMQMPGTFTWIAEAIDGHGNTIHRSGNIILIN